MRSVVVVSALFLGLAAGGCGPCGPAVSEETAALRPMLEARLAGGHTLTAAPLQSVAPAFEGSAGDLAAARELLAAVRAGEGEGETWRQTAAAMAPGGAMATGEMVGPRIFDAPAAEAAPVTAGEVKSGEAAGNVKSGAPAVRWWQPPPGVGWWQEPLAGRSFFEVVKDDGKSFPREFLKSSGDCLNLPSGLVLAGAAILSGVSRVNWDHHVDKSMLQDFSPKTNFFSKSDHLGDNLGNPITGFGISVALYGWSVETKNDDLYGFSKSLMQALILDDAATPLLKVATHENSPNHEDHYDWPSGHTSSTATMAAVAWDYYGPAAGVPLYLFSGFVAVSMMHERQHWLGDVIFGEALGTVIGHSVASKRLLHVGGFTVLPYAQADGGGVLLVKEF